MIRFLRAVSIIVRHSIGRLAPSTKQGLFTPMFEPRPQCASKISGQIRHRAYGILAERLLPRPSCSGVYNPGFISSPVAL